MKDKSKRAHGEIIDISSLIEVFVNQKLGINVCEHTVKMAPCEVIFTVCSPYIHALLIEKDFCE
jgi:hypothetical protein